MNSSGVTGARGGRQCPLQTHKRRPTAIVSYPPIPFGSVMNNENTDPLHWWQKPFANVQTNLQEIDATMDVEKALRCNRSSWRQ